MQRELKVDVTILIVVIALLLLKVTDSVLSNLSMCYLFIVATDIVVHTAIISVNCFIVLKPLTCIVVNIVGWAT